MGPRLIFGPYTLTLSGDLRKYDIAVKLQRKPLAVLRALLEQPGETVTRQDLHARLWPSDTFVDFDQGLNVAIKKVRNALCDSIDNPRYIETVPGVGYRFICPVRVKAGDVEGYDRQALPESMPAGQRYGIRNGAVLQNGGEFTTRLGSQWTAPQESRQGVPGSAEAPPVQLPARAPWRWAATVIAAAAIVSVALVLTRGTSGHANKAGPQPDTRLQTRRVVVLPFRNLTGDPAQEYFCEGLTDELIAQLSAINAQKLQVVARTSAMHYKGSSLNAAQIGSELKADYVLGGSVRRDGSLYRVTVQLTDAQSQTNIWAGAFDREFKDVLDVYRDVALAISGEIGTTISPQFQHPAFGAQPVNSLAHDAYLRGRFDWNKRTVPDLRDSVDEFERAIAIDPDYPEAHAGLADAYSLLASYGALPFRDGYPKARLEAEKALQLNPHSAEARASLGLVAAYYDWNFERAEQEFHASIGENPNYATAHHWYGLFLSQRGRHEDALAELNHAALLDPLSLTIGIDLANAYIYAHRYDEAERQLLKVRALDPTYYGTYGAMSWLYSLQGRLPEAERENKTLKDLSGNYSGNDFILAYAYAKAGQTSHARQLLLQISKMTTKRGDHSQCPMDAYLALGEDNAALNCLDEAIREHADWLVPLAQDNEFRRVASDPRFQSRLQNAGFPLQAYAHAGER